MDDLSLREWAAELRHKVDAWAASAGQLVGAAAAGDEQRLQTGIKAASREQKTGALIAAANAGQATAARILMDHGADASIPCGAAACPEVFPLHLAVASGSVGTATSLVTRAAPIAAVDLRAGWNAAQWARALHDGAVEAPIVQPPIGEPSMIELLVEAERFTPAVQAVRSGDTEALKAWLVEHPGRVDMTLGDNPRTLLLFATDWPGFWPNVAQTIKMLLEAGADVDQRFEGSSTGASETPLHWAASSNDVPAMEALLAGGAKVDALGGCVANGTPLFLAAIFRHWDAARVLLDAGARYSLPLVSAVGDHQRFQEFFDVAGDYHNPRGPMPHWERETPAQDELDRALWFACVGNQPEMARRLLERGATWGYSSPTNTTAKQEAQGHGDQGWDGLI